MSNIILKFYADNNLGDDMMIHQLLCRFPNDHFYVYSKNDGALDAFSKHDNFHQTDVSVFRAALRAKQFDAYLLVGGSVLNYNSIIGLLYQIKEILLCTLFKMKRAKTIVIGANLSEFPKKWYRFFGKMILAIRIRLLSLITVRDQYSYNIIHALPKSNAYVFSDIVFNYPMGTKPTGDTEPQRLGISVFANRYEVGDGAQFYDKLAQIANGYLREPSHSVSLFAFHSNQECDNRGVQQLYELIENKQQVRRVLHDGNVDAFVGQMSECDVFLPARFHSLVICLKLGIPFVPFIYANKTANLLDDIGYAGNRYNIKAPSDINIESVMDDVRGAAEGKGFFFGQERAEKSMSDAAGHFNMLEQALNAKKE